MNYDFVIYGGGMSAEIAAIALARNDIKVCFIKNRPNQRSVSNLVTFLSTGSVNYLCSILNDPTALNEFSDIKKITCKLVRADKRSSITFDNDLNHLLGKIVPNKIIHNLLDLNIKNNKNIEIINITQLKRNKIDSNKVCIEIDQKKLIFSKALILTQDDLNLLEDTKIKFISHNFHQTALSMNVTGDFKKQNHAFQFFTPSGPLAFLPYTKNRASLVWSLKNDSKELIEQTRLVNKVNEYLNSDIGHFKIEDIESHKLNFKFAKKLFNRNTIIMGNIAHNIHPIAGQGLNLSIKDISLFVEVILKYKSLGYEINNVMAFKEYDQIRKIDNAAYSFGTLTLDKLLSAENNLVSGVVSLGIKILENSKFVKKKIVKSATGGDHFNSL